MERFTIGQSAEKRNSVLTHYLNTYTDSFTTYDQREEETEGAVACCLVDITLLSEL